MINVLKFLNALPVSIFGFLYLLLFCHHHRVYEINFPYFEFHVDMTSWTYRYLWHKRWSGVSIGSVIIINPFYQSAQTRLHERRHSDQVFLFGVLQPILYVLSTLVIYLFFWNLHAYLDNPFERDARRHAGQQVDIPRSEWMHGPNDRFPWW